MSQTQTIKILPGKGQKYSKCICYNNIDLTTNGCVSGVDKNGYRHRNMECMYCYGTYTHKDKIIYKNAIDKSCWESGKVIRIGKMSEPGRLEERSMLYKVLETCKEFTCRPIVITKLLTFDKKVAELIQRAHGIIHFSVGYEHAEPGIIKYYDMTNKRRVDEAEKYKNEGCDVFLRLVIDVTKPHPIPSMPVILTPLRFFSKEQTKFIINEEWDNLKKTGRYEYKKGALRPIFIHSSFTIPLICGTVGKEEYCGSCGIDKNII